MSVLRSEGCWSVVVLVVVSAGVEEVLWLPYTVVVTGFHVVRRRDWDWDLCTIQHSMMS